MMLTIDWVIAQNQSSKIKRNGNALFLFQQVRMIIIIT
ncbi:Uncharacterized protein YR821_3373 [Yersinia ruckeri]|uniref:Uncharacterized protein n=1 Tax=Yersinia ruckeri TaxID=29486 RepID=A0A0A8VHG8_YERRU|nr:hypothetical protein yruck0001_30500 [Yersinia ruckeri ATCC 29473]QTD78289.1 Uncharacterized protein YR821_3373 [Yersinia ruckeri]CEK29202.1 hypothetical protein CSF007_17530 [Yersinia ruckeri]